MPMTSSFDHILHDSMQDDKFRKSLIRQLADFGDRLVQSIQAIPEGGITDSFWDQTEFFPEFVGLEGKSHTVTNLLEALSDSVIWIDRSGNIRGVNHSAQTLLGQLRIDLIKKSFLDLVHSDDREKLFDLWSQSLKNRDKPFHIRLRRNDSTYIETSAKAIPLVEAERFQGTLLVLSASPKTPATDPDPTPSNTIQNNSNSDDSTTLEQEIPINKIRRMLRGIKEMFYIASADGTITYINPEVENMLGYAPKEFPSMNVVEKFVDPQDRNHFSKLLRLHGWVKDFRYSFQHKNGEMCHLSETASIMTDHNDQIIGYYGIIRDRTAEHLVEKALKNSEKNYRFLVDQLPHALILLDDQGRVLHANKQGAQLLGSNSKQAIKGRFACDLTAHENASLVREAVQAARDGQTVSNQWQWADSRGNLSWWRMSFSPVQHNSHVEGIIWISMDIDQEKRMQDQLRLTQKMETAATLIGGLAHDFNNQLGVILGNASFIKDQLPSDHKFFEGLNAIESTALTARAMMNQLMTFTPRMHHQQVNLSVNQLVQNMVEFIRRTFPKNISVTHDDQADPDCVIGDPDNLYQALLSICVNSRDAMPNGGKITVTTNNTAPRTIDHGQSTIPFVHISITDTGAGMDPETCRRVCEPFFTTKRESGCTGLGMSTAYSIVQNHRGILEIDSRQQQGTRVDLYLPLTETIEEDVPGITQQDDKPVKVVDQKETLLIVDDEPQVRAMILRIFEKEGFEVFLAENGRKALDVLEQHASDVHLIILDMGMPEMDGKETMVHIRQKYPDIAVLLSSGYTPNQDVRELTKHPHTYFIHKPYCRSTVLDAVRHILAKSFRFDEK
jgi:two-component system cell cycle sensor histidine kinase/response regulator CckA